MEIKDNKAVGKSQIELLKKLMSLEELSEYCLVGGTNLALRYEVFQISHKNRQKKRFL